MPRARGRQASWRSLLISALVLSGAVLSGCNETASEPDFDEDIPGLGGGEPIDPTATFTRVQNEVFTPSCATVACHDAIGHQSNQILSAGQAYDMIVNRASVEMPNLLRIAPNDPANSYLYRKIVGAGITGDRMPQSRPPLTDDRIKLIRDWIRRGAPRD